MKQCINVVAPSVPGVYMVDCSFYPLILNYSIGRQDTVDGLPVVRLSDGEKRLVVKHFKDYPLDRGRLCNLHVASAPVKPPPSFALYLRVNDETPALKPMPTGSSESPVKFSWLIRPEEDGVQYRYRLFPDDTLWSEWDTLTLAEYFFIGPGGHTFEVAARYQDDAGTWHERPPADFQFVLKRAFVSEPQVIPKAKAGIATTDGTVDTGNVYANSRALLVGITEFEDPAFLPLPFINDDIEAVRKQLKQYGFEVEVLKGQPDRDAVVSKIEELTAKTRENDRIIIYFSTHGFQDTDVSSRAYLATHNCSLGQPSVNCIDLDCMERLTDRIIQKGAKHLLVILDACSSGLGVIDKSPQYSDARTISARKGAHVLTAGMAEQQAQMDTRLHMSTFTHFLVEGLSGAADYTKDSVISVTELLLYVRYNVARQTEGEQTPMMGRLKGPGEMIFDLR